MKAVVHISLKPGVLDPQGKAIEAALKGLGFDGVSNMRQGKVLEFETDAPDETSARETVEAMCKKLLANTVIENYRIDFTN